MTDADLLHLLRDCYTPTGPNIVAAGHALTLHAGVSQPAVSKHLTILKRAKLVRHRRDGRETHYRAHPDALTPMVDWLRIYNAFWRDRFDRLDALLERMDP
jgi:DNA-binding transcriptional ArsR family regulator